MPVIDFAVKRQNEEIQNGNDYLVNYWSAYLDGARAQKKEDEVRNIVILNPREVENNGR